MYYCDLLVRSKVITYNIIQDDFEKAFDDWKDFLCFSIKKIQIEIYDEKWKWCMTDKKKWRSKTLVGNNEQNFLFSDTRLEWMAVLTAHNGINTKDYFFFKIWLDVYFSVSIERWGKYSYKRYLIYIFRMTHSKKKRKKLVWFWKQLKLIIETSKMKIKTSNIFFWCVNCHYEFEPLENISFYILFMFVVAVAINF